MNQVFNDYLKNISFSKDLKTNVFSLLRLYGFDDVYLHCSNVAKEAVRLAEEFGEDAGKAKAAGLLHDISAVIPNDKRIEYAAALKIDVLAEERAFPMLLHQKYSKVMAYELFGITDESILNAIECHTTLKANASKLDMILFVADKLRWDQSGLPPFADRINEGLKISLEKGSLAYIEYMLEDKSRLKITHPWLRAAYDDLRVKV